MRTRITTAVVGAVALLTLTACSAEPDAPAAAEPAAQEGAQKATEERLAAAREAAGVPDEPTGAARTELIAAIAEVAPEAAEHEQKAVIAAQNQCAAMHAKAPNDRTHWWSSVVQPYLRLQGNDGWLDDSFVITELHVRTRHQNRGIGRSLITALTDTAAEPRSILSAIDTDSPARALYQALGYRDLARRVHFPSAPRPYAIMGAALPLLRRTPAP
ncbi:GNAT family N-acetyltransferase [Streptomyces sp. NPDC002454]